MAKLSWRGSQRYTAQEFKPYVVALGQVALAWNDLQESLGGLFWTATLRQIPQAGDFVDYASLHIWHSIRSDRSQREMLRAAINNAALGRERLTLKNDIKWLLKEADKLEDARNDAVHSPLFVVNRSLFRPDIKSDEPVAPAWWSFNPRAAKLSQKENILNEFRYCRDTAITLSDYARLIDRALINWQRPWPDKPRLPSRQQKNKAKHIAPQTRVTAHPGLEAA